MEKFLSSITARPNTIKTYTALFNKWVKPVIDSDDWNEDLFRNIIQWWVSNDLSPRTVKSLIHLASKYLASEKGIIINTKPFVSSVMRQKQETEIKALIKHEMEELVEECKGTDLYLPVLIASHTGMRRGEVFGLKWEDIDFLRGEVIVRRSYDGPTKNSKTRRVPMSKRLEKEFLAIYPVDTDNILKENVLPRKFDPNPSLKAACRRIGVKVISFHALRHTFASLALESGRSPRKVQQVLGHSNLSTTLNLYWSLTNEKLDLEFLK